MTLKLKWKIKRCYINLTQQPKTLPQVKLPLILCFTYLRMLPANMTEQTWDDTSPTVHILVRVAEKLLSWTKKKITS
jgi:hypothetical protein